MTKLNALLKLRSHVNLLTPQGMDRLLRQKRIGNIADPFGMRATATDLTSCAIIASGLATQDYL